MEFESQLKDDTTGEPGGVRGCSQSISACVAKVIPRGGLLSTVFNVASVCVGVGILGLPAATNSSGLAMALVYLVVILVLSVYSLHCLATLMERLDSKTYEGMARTLLGPGFDYCTAALRFLCAFGACVAFIISVGDIFKAILANTSVPGFWRSEGGSRLLVCILWLGIMLPLVIPRHVNSLRYVSMAGVSFIIFLVVVVIVHSCMNGLSENIKKTRVSGRFSDDGVHLFGTGNNAIEGLGVFMFSFICQTNVFEVYWDMEKRGAARFTLYSGIALGLCLALYIMTAFFGYLDFGGSATKSLLLLYNPLKEPAVMVAYAGLLVKVCASYAIVAMAPRNAIYHAIGWDADTVPFWKHCIAVITLSSIMLVCGLFIPRINIVFGFVGSLAGGLLAFLFPAIFMMYAGNWSLRSVGWVHYTLTYTLLFVGVIMVVFGTCATIYGVVVVK